MISDKQKLVYAEKNELILNRNMIILRGRIRYLKKRSWIIEIGKKGYLINSNCFLQRGRK
jgi:hypothetical protein